ncbi:MAG: transposase [Treponema sp.]|nr:transposase [Treponema sp.]
MNFRVNGCTKFETKTTNFPRRAAWDEKHNQTEKPTTNRNNGKPSREFQIDRGQIEISVPRDREGVFEPHEISGAPEVATEFRGFDDKITPLGLPPGRYRRSERHFINSYAKYSKRLRLTMPLRSHYYLSSVLT